MLYNLLFDTTSGPQPSNTTSYGIELKPVAFLIIFVILAVIIAVVCVLFARSKSMPEKKENVQTSTDTQKDDIGALTEEEKTLIRKHREQSNKKKD